MAQIPQVYSVKILTIVYNSIHKEAPQYINVTTPGTYDSRLTIYDLLSELMPLLPKTHKRAGDRSFSYISSM